MLSWMGTVEVSGIAKLFGKISALLGLSLVLIESCICANSQSHCSCRA